MSLNTSFVNDLRLDSLDLVELVMELEDEFDVDIPDDVSFGALISATYRRAPARQRFL